MEHFEHFTHLDDSSPEEALQLLEELDRAEDFIEMNKNGIHDYTRPDPYDRSENAEQLFWRLLQVETEYKARTGELPSKELQRLEATISESRLCMRLKWLGVRDWRLKPESKLVCGLAQHCTSLVTLSVRGDYDRDYSSRELRSVHSHVCMFIGGIIRTVPSTVKTIELRLSLSFIRLLLEKLHEYRPSVERVGIDLGAWIQVYPLRRERRSLKDGDVRSRTIAVARQKLIDAYGEEHGKTQLNDSLWHLSKEHSNTESEDHGNYHIYRSKQRNVYRDLSGTVVRINPVSRARVDQLKDTSIPGGDLPKVEEYDFFREYPSIDGEPSCPFDHCAHKEIAQCLDGTVVDTLPRMLKRLHLARCLGEDLDADQKNDVSVAESDGKARGMRITCGGAKLFALDPEPEERSTDPIHPLVAFQLGTGTDLEPGVVLNEWEIGDSDMLYPWLERTFKWRPVFDWDW
jgi:hypothetical protein